MDLSTLLRKFLEDCELERGHSPRTIANYEHYLGRFIEFAYEQKIDKPAEITLDLVRNWRLTLHRQNLKINTLNYHLIALRSFLKYLAKHDIESLPVEKIELADQEGRQIAFLEAEEIERLLAAPDVQLPRGLRDRAILETLFSTGLRVSELVAMDRAQVNLDRGEFGVRGKGGKVRVVFLSEPAKEWLIRYLNSRHDNDQALFIRSQMSKKIPHDQFHSTSGKARMEKESLRLTARQIERIVQAHAAAAGIVKRVHPHVLRHSLATDLLQNGADLRSVQEILGHASVTTTQVYTHVTNPRLKEVHQAFHRRQNKS
ncbi:MAG: tyrosine-type recombinase/integrase [Patescibacteria group bacterium]